jgi:hypothetical protein
MESGPATEATNLVVLSVHILTVSNKETLLQVAGAQG